MTDPGPLTSCPEPDVLAAFVEGKLDVATRSRIQRHAGTCPECPAVIAETSRFLRPVREAEPRRSIGRWWLFAAAAALAAVAIPALWPRDPLQSIQNMAARQSVRTVEGRLTGFTHRPFHAPRSGDSPGGRVLVPAGDTDADALHARGVASLINGDAADAARLLRSAADQSSRSDFWSDLAAAQISLATTGNRALFAEAVHSADRALALDPRFAPAHFNRAIAAEHLRRYEDAVRSYRQALDRDPSSPWADETRERIHHLETSLRGGH